VGTILVAQPAGSVQSLPITVTGADSQAYSIQAQAADVTLSLEVNGIALASNTVVSNANFCVGQVLTFSTNWNIVPQGVQSRSTQWLFDGIYYNDANQPSPAASINYTNNEDLLTNETTSAWWVSGGFNPPMIYAAQLSENLFLSNGRVLVLTASGLFNMYRPQARIFATTGTVALDTNYIDAQSGNHYFGLHDGIPSQYGVPGITFSNQVTVPAGFSANLQWVQVINSFALTFQTNDASGTWYIWSGTNGLDGQFPYPANRDGTAEDSPGVAITQLADLSYIAQNLSDSGNFTMWLELQPSGGAWVPIRKVNWSWTGAAWLSGTNWIPTILTNTPNPADFDTQKYPSWTTIVTKTPHYVPQQ
jgi:hypothetical protein